MYRCVVYKSAKLVMGTADAKPDRLREEIGGMSIVRTEAPTVGAKID